MRQIITYMNSLVDKTIAERRGDTEEAWPKDLLNAMLIEVDEETGERLDGVNFHYPISTYMAHQYIDNILKSVCHCGDMATEAQYKVLSVIGRGRRDTSSANTR